MTIQSQKVIYSKNIFFYENDKSSDILYLKNEGYCKLYIQVIHKIYNDGSTFYDICYDWGFCPWGEWYEANIILNNGKLLTWDELNKLTKSNNYNSIIKEKAVKLKKMFPFYEDESFIENNMKGDIIKKNKMTDEIVKYLIMNNSELKKISGNTTPTRYRLNIMNMITHLWD